MIIQRTMDGFPLSTGTIVTLGTFDGMHRGHQALIAHVVETARRQRKASVVITYDPHPREVLGHAAGGVLLLSTIDERMHHLERAGVDHYLVIPFTQEFSRMSAGEFFDAILVDRIHASHIVIGADHAFGRDRSGSAEVLTGLAAARGVEVTVFPEMLHGGEKISSSRIRRLLDAGDVAGATPLLGAPYALTGTVHHGDGLGATLGFRTANIHVPSHHKLVPANGVYVVDVAFDGALHQGIANIGVRPTISATGRRTIEAHILAFDGDLYGRQVTLRFHDRIREERKFTGVQQLIGQIRHDRIVAEEYFHTKSDTSTQHTSNEV